MHNPNLGFAPAAIVAVKAVPAILSVLGGKKKQEAAERAAQYQASEAEILAGRAVMATDVMTEADKEFLRKVWPQVHVAANWTDINWAAAGYPAGPPLTPAAAAAIKHAWPQVHVAARFDDVNWQYHAVPNDVVASLLPLPELGYQAPPPVSTPVTTPDPYMPINTVQRGAPLTASLFPGGLSMETAVLIAAVGVVGLLIFSDRR